MAQTTMTTEEPNVGRGALIGAIIGFVLLTTFVTVAGTLAGYGFPSALGLGTFVGAWGGIGFGVMMGGTIPLARFMDAASAHHEPDA